MSQTQQALSTFDQVFRSLLLSKFFTKGWGRPENLRNLFQLRQRMTKQYKCYELLSANPPAVHITSESTRGSVRILEGKFRSPLAEFHPEMLEPPVGDAVFQVVLPVEWPKNAKRLKPMCIQLAGTGDHYFWRRRTLLAKPLAIENGVGSILLENPFYGSRKPKDQVRSSLNNVCDLFVMGACLVMESLVLLQWCEQQGYGPLGLTGLSMGGHMASLAATNWPKPVSLAPCLSWTTASCVFTQGALAGAIPWNVLQKQLHSDEFKGADKLSTVSWLAQEEQKLLNNDAFAMGQEFARNYTPSTTTAPTSKADDTSFGWAKSLLHIRRTATDGEVLQFMTGVMDEFTHLCNFPTPVDPTLVIAVAADKDAYVPRMGVPHLTDLWPGAQVRYIQNQGHIQAFIFNRNLFRKTIVDTLQLNADKYY
uniref:Protein ABHD18 n=1 Tax=Plectus sambesii TaxID=2011161 RepID=A0A914WPW2_9BILA